MITWEKKITLTFWVLYDATDVVPGAIGGDGGQSDFVGQRDSQVWYGMGHQHTLLWLFTFEVYLLWQQVLLILDKTHMQGMFKSHNNIYAQVCKKKQNNPEHNHQKM